MRSCKKQSERPKYLRVTLGWPCTQFGMSATFQCSARRSPFETFWIFTRNEWGPDHHMRSCKKQPERFGMRLKCFHSRFADSLATTTFRWMLECNISMQCTPLKHLIFEYLQGINVWGPADHIPSCKKQSGRPKSLRVAVGWACASSVSVKGLQNSLQLVTAACKWMFECNIARHFETL